MRDETAKRIIGGDAVVWMLIKGDNAQSNKVARLKLDEGLQKIEGSIDLPPALLEMFNPEQQDQIRQDLPIRFSVIEVDRNDAKEPILMSVLKNYDPDLYKERPSEPFIMPVFGCSRALAQIPAGYVDQDMLVEAVEYLTGSCSCEIKNQNPGFDLFIPVDYTSQLERDFVSEHTNPELFNPAEESYNPAENGGEEATTLPAAAASDSTVDKTEEANGTVVAQKKNDYTESSYGVEEGEKKGEGGVAVGGILAVVAAVILLVGVGSVFMSKGRE